jgi:SMC interacting uncharacterized protein involved in chromosome segregation
MRNISSILGIYKQTEGAVRWGDFNYIIYTMLMWVVSLIIAKERSERMLNSLEESTERNGVHAAV